jgi:hypothetical protein
MKVFLLMFSLVLIPAFLVYAQNYNSPTALSNQKTKLYLELLKTEPLPVIDSLNPDSKEIPGGFEAGSTVKLSINGITAYHMISTTMETSGSKRWDHMRTEHWVSEDGFKWRRQKELFYPHFDSETGLWILTGSPFPYFDSIDNKWYIYFNYMAFNGIRSWNTPCLLRRAGARTIGPEGINGEFEFPGEIVAPAGIAYPTDAEASSISPPFKAADGLWYAFLGGGPKPLNETSGRWWVTIVKADRPDGPFKYQSKYAPVPIMDPTGYVENPLPMKFKGPKTGREYWAIIFNSLKLEVNTGSNSEIGFSFSTDGLNWTTENTQIIDLSKGLPRDVNPWWRAIRVPHQLVNEGDGIFTCFFSAYDKSGKFEGIGRATFRIMEEIIP